MLAETPIIPVVFGGDQAISTVRRIMGATDPAKAAEGTIRRDFAMSMTQNSVHGSDSPQAAVREVAFFFGEAEICHQREAR